MASPASTITSYDWSNNSTQLFSYLQTVANAGETLDQSDLVLTSLSGFINPLIKVSSHPLLKRAEFYDDAKKIFPKLQPAIASLQNNEIFIGCHMIAEAEAEEKKKNGSPPTAPIQSTLALEELSDALDHHQSSYVISFLKGCADDIHFHRGAAFTSEHLSRCQMIFLQIQGRLQKLKDIFACPIFHQQNFYETAYAIISQDDFPNVDKIDRLYIALMHDQIRSEGSTPTLGRSLEKIPQLMGEANQSGQSTPVIYQSTETIQATGGFGERTHQLRDVATQSDEKTPMLHGSINTSQTRTGGFCCCSSGKCCCCPCVLL